MPRIGSQMQYAVDVVNRHPGCNVSYVAKQIGPSVKFGSATVHRAIKAGLIRATKNAAGRYSLTATESTNGSGALETILDSLST